MGEAIEDLKAAEAARYVTHAERREAALDILNRAGVDYTYHNEGKHLRVLVRRVDKRINFWPGPDKWQTLDGKVRYGIDKLIKYANG